MLSDTLINWSPPLFLPLLCISHCQPFLCNKSWFVSYVPVLLFYVLLFWSLLLLSEILRWANILVALNLLSKSAVVFNFFSFFLFWNFSFFNLRIWICVLVLFKFFCLFYLISICFIFSYDYSFLDDRLIIRESKKGNIFEWVGRIWKELEEGKP